MWILSFALSLFFFAGCTSELDQHMNACKEAFPSYAETMSGIQEEWEDTFEVAISTSRIALDGPVGDLQSIRREARNVTPPDCMADAHQRYLEGMDTFINFFLEFMADADAEPDETDISIAQLKMAGMVNSIEQYENDPEAFFEEIRGVAATATAESAK